MVITPAVDRLSRDTTDLLIIARDMQRAGAGIRSLAEPFLDPKTSCFIRAHEVVRFVLSRLASSRPAAFESKVGSNGERGGTTVRNLTEPAVR